MQKLQEYWAARSRGQRVAMAASFAGALLAVALFAWAAARAPMALLYSGLDPAQAGSVIAEIDRRGVTHEVRGESIWVAAADRDRLRLDLAAQGLPAAGEAGYELLDGMSGFGTTSQMFDAAYWRAKEGELARTILALPNVKAARVHLAVPASRGFRREVAGTASVTITTTGVEVSREQAQSLQFLVSSGVPGMAPAAVTVIDSRQGVVSPGDDLAGRDREAEMKRNVERILEAHVGSGNAIVELSLSLNTDRENLIEQRFDPKERALISEEVQETSDQSTDAGPAPVTAASNLPDNAQAGGEGQSRANRQESRQRANYEVSQVTREVQRGPGEVRRLTVAVLVNGAPVTNAAGETSVAPRSEAELAVLRELVAAAVGFDEARGDQLTVKSMPFADMAQNGTLAERPGWLDRLALDSLARLAVIGLFAVVLAAVLMRPLLRQRAPQAVLDTSAALPAPAGGAAPRMDDAGLPALAMASPAAASFALPMATPEISFTPPSPQDGAVARLRELMRERREESVRILSDWIDEGGRAAR
ncbi:flagellar M-ring protein FliF [Paracoccus sp. S-4012]|uniref:flagellar basal-body MS-ring/collar protein FliF n=1 Tax=Paracoccus sp. S-4012 TaxID=2665648 RepID=UPI0012AFCB59|nr:flagellar basal-body MS-ring/collar protein FliF [Paracoccus sp. S-4012]MRX49706.1 flagellar M-ring protein FliF [Paracoccus sp. S-4012]